MNDDLSTMTIRELLNVLQYPVAGCDCNNCKVCGEIIRRFEAMEARIASLTTSTDATTTTEGNDEDQES